MNMETFKNYLTRLSFITHILGVLKTSVICYSPFNSSHDKHSTLPSSNVSQNALCKDKLCSLCYCTA